MKSKGKFILAAVSGSLTVLLIVLVRSADVAPIGAGGSSVGLSHLNRFVFDLFGVNLIWYFVTDWLGVMPILTAFCMAAAGFVQLIKRKRLDRVDRRLLLLGWLYLAVIGLYVLFEHAVVNVRPIIMPGGMRPEASFPSSHTMIVCVIMGSAMMLIEKNSKRKKQLTFFIFYI